MFEDRPVSYVLRKTHMCDRSAVAARVEPPSADRASRRWVASVDHSVVQADQPATRVTAGDPRERSQGCCSIRAVGMRLRGGCLHGTALGSHQLVRSSKSTILSGEAESCPDAGRFRVDAK